MVHGWIEYYDRNMVRLTREGGPNLFIFKHEIMYIAEDGRHTKVLTPFELPTAFLPNAPKPIATDFVPAMSAIAREPAGALLMEYFRQHVTSSTKGKPIWSRWPTAARKC